MKEIIRYIICGGLTTFVSWVSYWVCYEIAGMPNLAAQIVSWTAAVIAAFISNKLWVFESKSWSAKAVVPEALKFAGARAGTGLLETACMWLGVDILNFHAMFTKIAVSIAVVVLNYVFSKLLIFKGEHKQ